MSKASKIVEDLNETFYKVKNLKDSTKKIVEQNSEEDNIPPIIAKLVDVIQTEFTVSFDTYATAGVPVDWSNLKLYDELMDRAKTVLHAASTAKTILQSFSQD